MTPRQRKIMNSLKGLKLQVTLEGKIRGGRMNNGSYYTLTKKELARALEEIIIKIQNDHNSGKPLLPTTER